MTVTTTRRTAHRAAGRPLKSPLAVASGYPAAARPDPESAAAATTARSELPPRELQLTEFADHLRTINNRDGRPYEESTISTYVYPAKALDRWMAAKQTDGDFTRVDTAMLNRYFRDYYNEHGQGGTNAQQRNLLQLFKFLQSEYNHPHPYTEKLNRYAEVKGKPQTLSGEFIDDLLDVTGAGRARDFENARDHAIIRILRTEGIRRQELLGMVMQTLPADLIKNPTFRLVPLKGARAAGEGRLVTLAPETARAFALYLRVRRQHKLADSDWVWLGTRSRGKFGNTGIRLMLIRRAEEAGYGQARPHQFRHTFSDRWLAAGGSEGDLMRLNGWTTRLACPGTALPAAVVHSGSGRLQSAWGVLSRFGIGAIVSPSRMRLAIACREVPRMAAMSFWL
ncbi:MAG TPA: site-specific integrase [Streptosporangiaceae bacterium]|nr:site-specific integrase [Streptosporangiaceae bacterium]